VNLLIEDAMKFWGGVNRLAPARASFYRGYERLFGAQKDGPGRDSRDLAAKYCDL
jgi:hypothetical protein